MTQATEEENKVIENSKCRLLELAKINPTVYCVLNHVSTSGMTRRISFFMVEYYQNVPQITNISWYVANILDYKRNSKDGGLTVSGCGMDMGFAVVYDLSSVLYGHENRGGYNLKSQWL